MAERARGWKRQHEAFWRAHHEAWTRSTMNQREYCLLHRLPLKAFGNWRVIFKAEPQPPAPRLLHRRGGLSHPLGHSASPMTSAQPLRLFVPPAASGRRRAFSDADKRRIIAEAAQPGASLSAVARRYAIAARVLFRWRKELAAALPVFVAVAITDQAAPAGERAP